MSCQQRYLLHGSSLHNKPHSNDVPEVCVAELHFCSFVAIADFFVISAGTAFLFASTTWRINCFSSSSFARRLLYSSKSLTPRSAVIYDTQRPDSSIVTW